MNRLGFQARIVLISLAAGLPACAALLALLWTGDHEPRVRYGLSLLAVGALSGGLILLHRKLTFQFQTLANVVSALREGDFSIRARGETDKGLGEFAAELNILGEVLRRQRLGAVEAAALLQKVMKEIDVAILAFDDGQRLRLINRAGQRLLGIPGEDALGKTAAELDLTDCVEGEAVRTLRIRLPGGKRPLGYAPDRVSRGRAAPSPRGFGGPEPDPARGGAAGVAAVDPGVGPRVEQLADPHQVHRRESRVSLGA